MSNKNLNCTFSKIVRLVFHTILLAGLMFSGILPQTVKASSELKSGLEKTKTTKIGLQAPGDFTLTAGNDGHGTVTLNPIGGLYAPGTPVTLTPVPDSTYYFSSWSGANAADVINTNGVYTIVMNGDKNIQANFTQTAYTLTAGNDGHGTVTLGPPGSTYGSGSTVTLTPAPASGYQFSSWTGANSADVINTAGVYTIVMNGNKTVQANFVQTFTLTAGNDTHGTVTLSPPGGTYASGTVVTLTPVPNALYYFSTWSGTNAGNIINTAGVFTIVMNGNKTVQANFTLTSYTLTAGNNGHGTVTLGPPGGRYGSGSTVTLTPVPASGYQFSSWSGANSGNIINTAGVYTILMNGNKNVTANFTQITYTLTAGNDGHGTVSLNPTGGTYATGTTVTLTPLPNAGYLFGSWSGANLADIIDIAGVYTIVMNGNKTVQANFSQATYTLTITSAHGTVTKSPDQPTYHYGDVVHLTQTPSAGYTFDHWSYSGGATIYPPGAVAISFDDGYPSTFTDVYPYMHSKGVLGTLYFICSWANKTWSLTTGQLQVMDANGWSIANHSTSHGYLDTLTETQQEAELLGCKNFLDSIGLTKASSHVDYPYSIWNTDTLTAMTNTGMLTGRTSGGTTFDPKTVDILQMPSGSSDTLAYAKQLTDYAVANHQIFLYHGHQMGQPGEMSLADFEAWIDYLVANQIPTLTINDVYARTFSPIDITINGNTSVTANYNRTPSISGNVGVGGAVLNRTGGSPVVADASGNYTITVPSGWSGTVTPVKLGYTFTPASRNHTNVAADLPGQNFTAAPGNTPPVIVGGTFANVTMSMNGTPTPFALTLNAVDFDPSDTLTWSISSAAAHGIASASGTGTSKAVSYTPTTDYAGSDSFVVQVSDGTATDTITINVTIVAAPIYTLSVSKIGTGSGTLASIPTGIDCGATCSASFNYNSSVTLTATPATGSSFTGWSGAGCTGTGTCVVTMGGARTVTATFTLNTYLLTVTPAGNGSGTVTSSPTGIDCGATCSASFNYNTSVTLTATPVTSSNFTGWSGGGCTGTGTCVVSVDAAKTVTATFTLKTYLLTVTPAGNGSGTVSSDLSGIDCGSTCSHSFDYNTTVTLTATHATGSTFTGWSGEGCNGTGTCVVNMTTARTVTATFTLNTYLLTVTPAGNGSGTVISSPSNIDCGATCSATFDYNTSVTLTATPVTGSRFTGWSGEGCSGTGTCIVTMDAARSVTANFTLIIYQIFLPLIDR